MNESQNSAPAASESVTTSSTPGSQTSAESSAPSSSNYDQISNQVANEPDIGFEGLGKEIETDLAETQPQVAVAPKPAVQPSNPVVNPNQSQAPAVNPQQVAQTQVQTQQSSQQPEAASSPQTLDDVLSGFAQHPDVIADSLAQSFTISPELAAELETDYNAAIPKLLAKTFTHSVHASLQYMRDYVPQLINQHLVQQESYRQAENSFFSKFSQLNRNAHGNDIRSYAQAFAAQNPRLTQEQLFNLVGTAVMAKHGLVPGQVQNQVRPQGFSPAVNNAPLVSQQPVQTNDPFWGMSQNFDEQ